MRGQHTTSDRLEPGAPTLSATVGLVFVALVTLLGGCGGGGNIADAGVDTSVDSGIDGEGELVALPREPVAIASVDGCSIDIDCAAGLHCFEDACVRSCDAELACAGGASCDERGRCVSSNKGVDDEAARPSGRIVEFPTQGIRLRPGAESFGVRLRIESDDRGLDSLDYRLRDSAGLLDPTRRYSGAVSAEGVFDVEVPVGFDTVGELEASDVSVELITSLGQQTFNVSQQEPVEGRWSAGARVANFGSVTLPMSFELATEPPGAAVDDAETVWMALSTSEDHLFRPLDAAESGYAVRALEYDALLDAWVGTWRHDFDGPDGSFLERTGVRSPQRTIRLEVRFDEDGAVFGTFSDRWTGLYDDRTVGGVATPGVTVFGGDFEAVRLGDGVLREAGDIEAGQDDASTLELRPELVLGMDIAAACTDAIFSDGSGAPLVQGDEDCVGADGEPLVLGLEELANVAPDEAASCALAVADAALSGATTADALQSYFDGGGGVDGLSFAEFIEACAAGEAGFCRPSDAVLCARDLTAWAYVTPVEELASSAALVDRWTRLSREAFIGPQLGAYQQDASLRLDWLQSSDYPDFVSASLADGTETLGGYIGELLETWSAAVLDVHLDVVFGQMTPASLGMFNRQVTAGDAEEARQQVLFELTQSWRASMTSLVLGADRWNVLLRGTDDRAEASGRVVSRALDLYVAAGLLAGMNQRAGSGFANAAFGGGFGNLQRSLQTLLLPFDEVLIARDIEVVVNRSLVASENADTLLGSLETAADAAVTLAGTRVSEVIAESSEDALNRTQLENRLRNEIDALRDELLELCGQPVGCTLQQIDAGAEGCELPVGAGKCGFVTAEDGVVGPGGEAGSALLSIIEAELQVTAAQTAIQTLDQRISQSIASTDAFAAEVAAMNTIRQNEIRTITELIALRRGEYTAELAAIADRIAVIIENQDALAADAAADAAAWNSIAVDGRQQDFAQVAASISLLALAKTAADVGSMVANNLRQNADGLPTMTGAVNDSAYRANRWAALQATTWPKRIAKLVTVSATSGSTALQALVTKDRMLRGYELQNLADVDLGDDLVLTNEIALLEVQARIDLNDAQVQEWGFGRKVAAALRASEARLAFERDLQSLADRRDETWGLILDASALNTRLGQAFLAIDRAELAYGQLAVRSELLAARRDQLIEQRGQINLLIGSPSSVFMWANRLERAEGSLSRARSALWDWLVALEYYAVRPFVDLRIQLLLAQNPYQFEDIAAQMRRLQDECGGQQNYASVTVSLAEAMGYDVEQRDPVSGDVVPAAEAFRAALQRGDVAVGRRVRLGSTLFGADLWSLPSLWAGTIDIDIERFPNLATNCNARLYSVDLAVVGDVGADVRPTVQMVHSGASELRSCQPDLQDYLDSVGPDATSFGLVTRFEAQPRVVGPLSDVGDFASPPDLENGNETLRGLPFAAEYVVLIDRDRGDNQGVAWSELEDVLVRFNFTYQDPFPRSECR